MQQLKKFLTRKRQPTWKEMSKLALSAKNTRVRRHVLKRIGAKLWNVWAKAKEETWIQKKFSVYWGNLIDQNNKVLYHSLALHFRINRRGRNFQQKF